MEDIKISDLRNIIKIRNEISKKFNVNKEYIDIEDIQNHGMYISFDINIESHCSLYITLDSDICIMFNNIDFQHNYTISDISNLCEKVEELEEIIYNKLWR